MNINNKKFKFLYSGSFDPVTNGHLSVPISLLKKDLDANVIMIIVVNPDKKGTFSLNERKFIIENSIPQKYKDRIKVVIHEGLVPDYVYDNNIPYILKGVRDSKDSSYEIELATLSSEHFGEPMTLLIPQTDPKLSNVSSTNLKMLSNMVGILLDKYAPAFVREILKMKRTGKLIVGVTGGITCGKSTLCRELAKYSQDKDIKIHHIDMDKISHIFYEEKDIPLYDKVRSELAEEFGSSILKNDETIDRKALGEIVFSDKAKLDKLTDMMLKPTLHLMSRKINSLGKGIVLIESAILIDRNLTEIVDENIINVKIDPKIQIERMLATRGLDYEQAEKRLTSQLSQEKVTEIIKFKQEKEFDRMHIEICSDKNFDISQIYENIEQEYLRRSEVRRYGNLFIPSELTYEDEKAFVDVIIQKYSEKHRGYHSLKHIGEMLMNMQKIKFINPKAFEHPIEIYLAIIFHDSIYDVREKDNEAKSAEYAREYLSNNLKNSNIDIEYICKLINLTALHGSDKLDIESLSEEEKIFLDMDTAILAANELRVKEYENGIYYEYSPLCLREDYVIRRKHFLEKMNSKNVFHSEYFRSKFENIAKENLTKLIKSFDR